MSAAESTLNENDLELLYEGTVPGPDGTFGFMVKLQLRNPVAGAPDEAVDIVAPRAFATAAQAEAMGRRASAYCDRTGLLPRLGEEDFYITPEPTLDDSGRSTAANLDNNPGAT